MGKNNSNVKPTTPARRAAKPAPAATKKAGVRKPPTTATKTSAATITADDIAMRAYFIAEKRRQLGLPGDEHQDWLDAERQLRGESAAPRKKRLKAAR